MKICKANALRLWEEYFGNSEFAEDFHGNLMCRDGYGDANFSIYRFGERIYCGWNIHHILPLSWGGTNEKHNFNFILYHYFILNYLAISVVLISLTTVTLI